jgi:uncharacterized protein
LLPVRAQPGARKNEIAGWHNGRLKVRVTQIPEKGKANQALSKVLAKTLGISRSQISLVSGETSREKVFLIRQVTAEDLSSRIAAAMPESD